MRSLRIFRDETSLAATHALPDTIKGALDGSRYFILVASPAAAQSKWVAQEIQHWLATKGSASLLIVLTEGEIVWRNAEGADAKGDFDWTRTTALPECLKGKFDSEPKWEDLTKIRQADDISPRNPVLQHVTASLFCVITGRALDDVIGEDIRVYRRNRQILSFGAVAISLATAGILVFLYLYIDQLWKTQSQLHETNKEQGRYATVIDILTTKSSMGAFLLPDLSNVENRCKLVTETIRAASNIARRDLKKVKILWVDDNPTHNMNAIGHINSSLIRIGAEFEQTPTEAEVERAEKEPDVEKRTKLMDALVKAALERLQLERFDLVITNYGKGRCLQKGRRLPNACWKGRKNSPTGRRSSSTPRAFNRKWRTK